MSNSGEEEAAEVVTGEADEGAEDQALRVLPADALEALETELDLVCDALRSGKSEVFHSTLPEG